MDLIKEIEAEWDIPSAHARLLSLMGRRVDDF